MLNRVENSLKEYDINDKLIKNLEDDNDVVIVYTSFSNNINAINEEIIYNFEKNKIKLNKFWITRDTINALENRSINKIYDQGVAKYKVLTKFLKIDNNIYVIAMPLPYMHETIGIINRFNIFIMIITVIAIISLVYILSKKIVKPIEELKELSKNIALLDFKKIDINTNDEIEELAYSINKMSESLENAHKAINSQNNRLKQLLSDVSHELKTPLALIKVYSQGIEDGLDDGTYLNIIQEQVDRVNFLIEKLLFWAKIDNSKFNNAIFDLKTIIEATIKKYKFILEQNEIDLIFKLSGDKDYYVNADKEMIKIVLDNLITNAIKYTNNKEIAVLLKKEDTNIKLVISNGIKSESIKSIKEIWSPFYVGEKSRNKNLSGTGLGLSIVESILKKHNYNYGIDIINNKIEFYIEFCNIGVT